MMDTEIKKQKVEEALEVTGVSRSGRVRKKSSKLTDFESPDDIDSRRTVRAPPLAQKVGPRPPMQPQGHVPPSSTHQHPQQPHHASRIDEGDDMQNVGNSEEEADGMGGSGSDSDFYDATLDNQDSMESMDTDDGNQSDADLPLDSSGEANRMSHSGSDGRHHLNELESRPSHSLYMMEKSNKKKLLVKDGKVVGRAKAQRKDKGKSRITAYMMWSRDVRNDLIRKYPEMDFSAISKRLGEMWTNVNYLERYVWKRKAKRLSAKKAEQTPVKTVSNAPSNSVKGQQSSNHNAPNVTPPNQHGQHSSRSRHQLHSKPTSHNVNLSSNVSGGAGSGGGSGGMYRVVGVGPAEVGAHLRLLGESLAIIGERLKEHEGQIAVSGSVSVLLDTLLCSLAPLVCLTAHIPSIAPPLHILQDTLDNIAYIMPGL